MRFAANHSSLPTCGAKYVRQLDSGRGQDYIGFTMMCIKKKYIYVYSVLNRFVSYWCTGKVIFFYLRCGLLITGIKQRYLPNRG